MATNRKQKPGYQLSVVCSNPATPSSGDPVRFGELTGVALTDESDAGNATGYTTVDFGPAVWELTVDDNESGGIAVGDPIYYHDTPTGSPTTNLNNSSTGMDAFFGVALEAVSSNATTAIDVLHIPLGSTLGTAGGSDRVRYTETVLTSAQVKALNATPITLVAAPGADLAIVPLEIALVMNYGGSNAFTESADDLSLAYATGPAEILEIESTGLIGETNDEARFITIQHAETFVPVENDAVVITNLDDEIAGNAANDNTLTVRLYYRVVPTDA